MPKGTIKDLFPSKKYGLIQPDDGGEKIYFSFSTLKGVEPHLAQRIEYEVERTNIGLKAKKVRVLSDEEHNYRFNNPYNFIRYLGKRPQNCVLGDCSPPPHDRFVALTGRITCTLETATPLFISDSHAVRKEKEHGIYRFFQYEGQPALPASSLRGMIRSIFEAITNSCFVIFDEDKEYPLEYRLSSAPPNMVPVRVLDFKNSGALLELLDCTVNPPIEIKNAKPVVIKAAHVLNCYPPRVYNAKNKTSYDPKKSILQGNYLRGGIRVAALVTQEPKADLKGRFRAYQAVQVVPADEHKKLEKTLEQSKNLRKVFGWLYITGPNIENKHNERLFFRWDDNSYVRPKIEEIPKNFLLHCDASVVSEYNEHLKGYWERLGDKVKELGAKRWPNSLNDLPQPSLFVEEGQRLKQEHLCYAEIDKNTNKVLRLRPVCIPRIRYKYPRQKFFERYEHLMRCSDYNNLCPACRIFGWVHAKGDEKGKKETISYASRVSFSHGKIESNYKEKMLEDITLAILATPKPTATAFYLLNGSGHVDPLVDYNNEDFLIRGRKLYRHHGKMDSEEYSITEKNNQNRTIRGALKEGTHFTFTVDFENLSSLELGALLYAIELEEDMVHRLGFAKPFGFGSVKIKATKIEIIDWEERLKTGKVNVGWKNIEDHKDHLKEKFIEQMRDYYKEDFNKLLNDLRILLNKDQNLPVHYPRSTIKPNIKEHPSFEWFVGNKKRIENKKKNKPSEPVTLNLPHEKRGLPLIKKDGN